MPREHQRARRARHGCSGSAPVGSGALRRRAGPQDADRQQVGRGGVGEDVRDHQPRHGPGARAGREGDKEDIDRAVRAARRTFDDGRWAHTNPSERQRLLLRIADLIEANGDELAQLETLDNGKPFMESRHVDIPASAETFRYYAGWVNKIY